MKITQTFAIFFLCCAFLLTSPQVIARQETNVLEPQAQAIDWVWSGQKYGLTFSVKTSTSPIPLHTAI